MKVLSGSINLENLRAGYLVDSLDSWRTSRLYISGFEYGQLRGFELDVVRRLEWLAKNDPEGDVFQTQPYQHLAKIYGEMGQRWNRLTVLKEMETRLRASQIRDMLRADDGPWAKLNAFVLWVSGNSARILYGYGYRPARLLMLYVPLILVTALIAKITWDEGSMTPAASPILVSMEWQKISGPTGSSTPGIIWAEKSRAGQDYETFHPVIYAADLALPLIDLGQERSWAPSTNRGWWGFQLWWIRWFVTFLGYGLAFFVSASITGLIRND